MRVLMLARSGTPSSPGGTPPAVSGRATPGPLRPGAMRVLASPRPERPAGTPPPDPGGRDGPVATARAEEASGVAFGRRRGLHRAPAASGGQPAAPAAAAAQHMAAQYMAAGPHVQVVRGPPETEHVRPLRAGSHSGPDRVRQGWRRDGWRADRWRPRSRRRHGRRRHGRA
ncbi:MAG TPA: hypothetical protein VF933_13095, partial [Streptosporangiaceae bacterium]